MKRIGLCLLALITISMHAMENSEEELADTSTPAAAPRVVKDRYLPIKEKLMGGGITLTAGYLLYKGLHKVGYLPACWDPLPIIGSLAAGVGGLGLLHYARYYSHRGYAILNKNDYIEWEKEAVDETQQQEKELDKSFKESLQTHLSCSAFYKTWRDAPRIEDLLGKSKALDKCFNRVFYPALAGISLIGLSVASNPVGFKAAQTWLPDIHPWAAGMLSAGINMFAIKSLWAINCWIFPSLKF